MKTILFSLVIAIFICGSILWTDHCSDLRHAEIMGVLKSMDSKLSPQSYRYSILSANGSFETYEAMDKASKSGSEILTVWLDGVDRSGISKYSFLSRSIR
jgi:hypothetical protein